MSIENKGFFNPEMENINNSLSENEELLKTKEILEKKETIGNQEKLEAYINYLVDWKNEIVTKQERVKNQVQEILIDGNMGGFFHPSPGKYPPAELRGANTLFSKLAEQFQEIQNERNDWAKRVSSSFKPTPYNGHELAIKQKTEKSMENYFFASLEDNEHLKKSIESLGLNIYEHLAVVVSKDVLEGELPLYERVEEDDSIWERWLRIKDDKYIVETKYDEERSDNYSYTDKEFNSYKEAEKAFLA